MTDFKTKPINQQPFCWSFGKSKYDTQPIILQGTWRDYVDGFIEKNRARRKGLNYFTSAFGGDGRRCTANAIDREFLSMDNDGNLLDAEFYELVAFLGCLGEGIAYETASSQLNARRVRYIAHLRRPVNEDESKLIGAYLEVQSGIKRGWDSSTYRASQPVYLPPVGVTLIRFEGSPLDVDGILSGLPKPKPKIKPFKRNFTNAPDAFEFFSKNNLVLSVGINGTHKVICPWSHAHTDNVDGGAAFFEPSDMNGLAGGFHCLHQHCVGKSIKDVFELMADAQSKDFIISMRVL